MISSRPLGACHFESVSEASSHVARMRKTILEDETPQREKRGERERELSHAEGYSCQQSKSASQLISYLYAATWNTPKGGQTEGELLVSPQTHEEIK